MATAPMSAGQMKELVSAIVEAIPTDLSNEVAQKWIGRKKELGNQLRKILTTDTTSKISDISWLEVYKALGMGEEYLEAAKTLTVLSDPNLWTMPVVKGVTCNKVVAAIRKLGVSVYLYFEDLDKSVPSNDRDPNNNSYVVSFKRSIEADEENKNLSTNDLAKQNHKGITLLERLLLELGYFLATGKHLDEKNWTLCTGSRDSGGDVPVVCWAPGCRGVYVRWSNSDYRRDVLRSRSVVSLSVEPEAQQT